MRGQRPLQMAGSPRTGQPFELSQVHRSTVKGIVAELKKRERPGPTWHRKGLSPVGQLRSIDMGERFQGQAITVKPGAALSLQMHHHRA
jgi:mannose-1-phosphate guanylyltransferase / mannose-6-phosphate isomerase